MSQLAAHMGKSEERIFMPMSTLLRFSKIFALTGVLVACGRGPETLDQTRAPTDVVATPIAATIPLVTREFQYVTTVTTGADDTVQGLEREFGGRVAAFSPNSGYALIATNDVTSLKSQAHTKRNVQMEANRDVFSGGGFLATRAAGRRTLWAGGENISLGGRRTLWAGGAYQIVPENTGLWQQISLERAHALAPKLGAGVTVAVIDTGLDLNHPAFAGTLAPQADWWDFYDNDALPNEQGSYVEGATPAYGHGTSVAGIVLQVAPGAKILPLRVLGPDGSGDVLSVMRAIDWAVVKGARVINLSLGSEERSRVVQEAIKRATSRGVLVVSSAGNENRSPITFPANDAASDVRALGVGSVDASDRKSGFSNYGTTLEMVAPGENVFGPGPGGQLVAWSGTSMAAPMAAGGLALALGQSLAVPLSDVTMKMAENGFDPYNNNLNEAYKDQLGKRRLDVAKFLENVVQR